MDKLSAGAIREFKRIHKQKFGQEISTEQAEQDGLALLWLVMHTQPVPTTTPKNKS